MQRVSWDPQHQQHQLPTCRRLPRRSRRAFKGCRTPLRVWQRKVHSAPLELATRRRLPEAAMAWMAPESSCPCLLLRLTLSCSAATSQHSGSLLC